ncbi:MAG: hypothetical protein ABSG69_08040 [Candidatus Acidiferrum sp.]|jgi:hypothetical protein
MSIQCNERGRIFMDGTPEEWAALEQHAASCPECAEEVRAWRELSTAAAELRAYSEDPALWTRISASLETPLAEQAAQESARQSARQAARESRWAFLGFDWRMPLVWQTALAAALVLAMTLGGAYLYEQNRGSGSPLGATGTASKNPLLNDRALSEVERTENAYMQAIDKLAGEAKPQLDAGESPLMDSYREKLLVLDSAIDELRLEAGQNPSNAHLRYQLLAMYREKQGTLQEILESKQ